ncbi:MAG: OmpA family protein [Filomicrobium sp.]
MKCNPFRWLWGLLPVFALLWLTVVWEKDPIQEDLRQRTQAALSDAGLAWAGTGFDGRDGLLKGLAFREEHPDEAVNTVRKVWGVRVVEENVDLIDLIEEYAWQAEIDGSNITLSGYVPNEELQKKIYETAKARFPKFTIEDQTKLARGAPDTKVWMNGITFGIDRLTQLSKGNVELKALDLSIAGEARDFAAFKSAKAALAGAMPDSVNLASDKIRPPIVSPYTWNLTRSATQVVLAGHVPSEKQREALFAAAKKGFPNLVIIDRMETAAGAPKGWGSAATNVINQLVRLTTGKATMNDKALSVTGEAPDEETAISVASTIRTALPSSFKFDHDITFPEPKPPLITPFTTQFEVDGDLVRLTGYAPDEDARTALFQHAKNAFPDLRIVDNMELGSGAPEGWQRCLFAGITAAGQVGNGKVAMSDGKLELTAKTQSEELGEKIPGELRAATTRACETEINLSLDLPEEPNLFWRASYGGSDKVVLDGQVPDIETLTQLLSAARKQFPEAEIDNQMTISPGFAAKWQTVAVTGVNLLALLRNGEARLLGQELTIVGVAADTAIATAIKDRLDHNLAKSYSGRSLVEVKSDAMIWAETEAKRKKEEAEELARRKAEALEQERKAAEEAERQRLEAEEANRRQQEEEAREKARETDEEAARQEGEQIEATRQREQEEAKRKRAEAEAAERRAAEETARLRAEAEAAERQRAEEARKRAEAEEAARRAAAETARLKAEAEAAERKREEERRLAEEAARKKADEEKLARLKARQEALRKQIDDRPLPPKAEACQKRLRRAAAEGVILFEYAKYDLTPSSYATLNRLASIANGCEQVRLIVEGHTDSIGQRADNNELSLRRAAAVIDYLVSAGVPRRKLDAIGYGEEKPLAPNNSSSNRAKNRRIEFTVRVQAQGQG